MSAESKIEWTDRTWNPLTGCTKVSPGCGHCYAKTMHERFNGPGSFDTITLHPERLRQPLSWRQPSMVFVNSMSDLFHRDVPEEYIAHVFGIMASAGDHTFQVLTKRHARMRSLLNSERFRLSVEKHWISYLRLGRGRRQYAPRGDSWPLPNVWLGVSVENQQWAYIRIPALLDTPAAVRFLSCEPLLGPVDLTRVRITADRPDRTRNALTSPCAVCGGWGGAPCSVGDTGAHFVNRGGEDPCIDWVIVGGESGHGARLMQEDWALALRDQCQSAGVPFLFKQWGEWAPIESPRADRSVMQRVGKKAAGRELDGRTWDEYPTRELAAS